MKIKLYRPTDPEGAALWEQTRKTLEAREDPIDYAAWAEEIRSKCRAAIAARDACLCGKRVECACRMRLPVVDAETGSEDE